MFVEHMIKGCKNFPGSILVFLPGYEDILTVREKILKMQGCFTKPTIFALHSQMGSHDQQRVFEPVASGYRKVVRIRFSIFDFFDYLKDNEENGR